ncbi:MAG: XkdX family protein [Lachnospiraceae bacterium]|nr:XkdX family protein [Lachnospiraceae bacterium]
MEHSENFSKVKDYYTRGLWSISQLQKAVDKWITPEEYAEITGHTYS